MSLVLLARNRILDKQGIPFVGSKVFIFEVGTTDTKPVFLDADFTPGNEATQPLVTDADGLFGAFYTDGNYKQTVENPDGTGWSDDNIEPVSVPSATTTIKGIVQFATPSQVSAKTPGFVVDTKDLDLITITASQVTEGVFSLDRIPNISPSKVNNDDLGGSPQTLDVDVMPSATTTGKGIVEKATDAETLAGTAEKYPDAAEIKNNYAPTIADNYMLTKGSPNSFLTASGVATVAANSTTVVPIPGGFTMVGTYGVTAVSAKNDASANDNVAVIAINPTSFTILNGADSGSTDIPWTLSGRAN